MPGFVFALAVIDTDERLQPLLAQLENAPWIALDTEANSLYAYPPQLCLIQISIPNTDVIIDPLAPINLTTFFETLKNRELILHGADYDLRLLWQHFGFRPKAIFDTMWAARILGLTEFGLTHLVAKLVGVSLEKGPQKMNWGKRPLTDRMERYAKNDTHYLEHLAQVLTKQLVETDRISWQKEICDRLIRDCAQTPSVNSDTIWRIKGSSRLNRKSLGVVRELWKWREAEAIRRNKPPYFVLSSETLIEISIQAASENSIASLIPKHLNHAKENLRTAIDRGLTLSPSELPTIHKPAPHRLTGAQRNRFETLKKLRDKRAMDFNFDPSLIASKTTLVSLAQHPGSERSILMQWQQALLSSENP